MASLESMKAAKKASSPNKDVELAVRMTIKLLRDGGGMKVIQDATKTKDPAQIIGQFLAQLVGQLAEQLDKQYGIDPRIFLSKGGWLDHVLDYIEKQLGLPEEFSDQIEGQVLEVIKAAALGGNNQPQEQAPPAQGPAPAQPMQQGAPAPMGGLGG